MSRSHHERRQQQSIMQVPDPVQAGLRQLQAKEAVEASVGKLRIDISAQIMAQLVGVEYMSHLQGREGPLDPTGPAKVAVASAFALLVELGIYEKVEDKPAEVEANGDKPAESSILIA